MTTTEPEFKPTTWRCPHCKQADAFGPAHHHVDDDFGAAAADFIQINPLPWEAADG